VANFEQSRLLQKVKFLDIKQSSGQEFDSLLFGICDEFTTCMFCRVRTTNELMLSAHVVF
jgi:hypothetical protein